ncbi:hypothetical protein GCM10017673_18810 [Streptosporangium violaceochromogenes]|nr:hypothetical protein GCM10017673_18810 [Streptosporangium violaceochromogenes]
MTVIRAVRAAAYRVPTDRTEADGTLAWDATTLVTAELDAEGSPASGGRTPPPPRPPFDATRCGGYTGWLDAAAVARAHHLRVSAHCAPSLHLPVAAATPNLRHTEWFHDHVRIESELFGGAADPSGGTVRPRPDVPGHGLVPRYGVAGHRVA